MAASSFKLCLMSPGASNTSSSVFSTPYLAASNTLVPQKVSANHPLTTLKYNAALTFGFLLSLESSHQAQWSPLPLYIEHVRARLVSGSIISKVMMREAVYHRQRTGGTGRRRP